MVDLDVKFHVVQQEIYRKAGQCLELQQVYNQDLIWLGSEECYVAFVSTHNGAQTELWSPQDNILTPTLLFFYNYFKPKTQTISIADLD